MWILKNLKTGQNFFLLQEKTKYTIGKLSSDLVLKGDNSVSRSHASLYLTFTSDAKLQVELKDAGSKYGTFVNEGISLNVRVGKDERILLEDNDRIRFGALGNIWTLSKMELQTVTSSLIESDMQKLERDMLKLGGKILNKYESSCTHLTMSEISVTLKLIQALVDQMFVVTCNYWSDLLNAAHCHANALPDALDYKPKLGVGQMAGSADADISIRPERKHLFDGMVFVFMNRRHYEIYAEIIEKAGGTCKELSTGVKKTFLIKNNVVVVQYVPSTASQSSQTVSSIMDFLGAHSRRLIPEYEIGHAIVYCSTEKYCNPAYKIVADLIPVSETILTEENLSDMLPCTERNPLIANKLTNVVVEETPAATTCQDGESMDTLRFTESNSKECQKKRNRSSDCLAIFNNSDDEGDDNLPISAKRPHLEQVTKNTAIVDTNKTVQPKEAPTSSKSSTTPKSNAKPQPLAIVFNTNRRTINTSGFLERSQAATTLKKLTTNAVENVSSPKTASQTRKRNRIALITDDDDADDDLFDFTDSKNKGLSPNKKKSRRTYNNDSDDDDLFEFTSFTKDPDTETVDLENQNAIVATTNKKAKKNKSSTIIPKPKVLPRTISTDGWLSRSFNSINIKSENLENTVSESKPGNQNCEHTADTTSTCHSNATKNFQSKTISMDLRSNRKCFVKTPILPARIENYQMISVVAGPNYRSR